MIDAISTRFGNASLIRRMRGTHQSSALSEMSSQFHDECSAAPGRFFIETWASSGDVRMNFAFAPTTFTTGCSPIVFVTTPPHPASNARRMLLSDSVGGAEERRKGLSNLMPVKVVERSAMLTPVKTGWELGEGWLVAGGGAGCPASYQLLHPATSTSTQLPA